VRRSLRRKIFPYPSEIQSWVRASWVFVYDLCIVVIYWHAIGILYQDYRGEAVGSNAGTYAGCDSRMTDSGV
jgi:hypothetical protein